MIKNFQWKNIPWFIRLLVAVIISVALVLGVLWGQEPATFKVKQQAIIKMKQDGFEQMPTGYVYTNTLVHMLEILVEKPGGYLLNDIAPPGVLLDNVQGWEYGVSMVLSHTSEVLVDHFAIHPMQSKNDRDYIAIWPYYYQTSYSWIFPSAEQDIKKVIKAMHLYMQRLHKVEGDNERSYFYVNSENLNYLLKKTIIVLGFSKRLKGSADDFLSIPERFPNITIEPLFMQKTPWLLVDDYFYTARGISWALLHIYKAIKIEFKALIIEKKAMMTLNLIISTLESSLSASVFTAYGFEVSRADSVAMAAYLDKAKSLTVVFLELIN